MNRYRLSVAVAAAAYLAMVVVNVLANAIPIGGITTGAVSDAYVTLFAPAGYTFAVWGVIYLLLGWYAAAQIIRAVRGTPNAYDARYSRINLLFALTSVANIAWIFAWHHLRFGLTVVLMGILLALLAFLSFDFGRTPRFVGIVFGVYFGWITVAAVANVATWLVSLGYGAFDVRATILTVVVMYVALVLSVATILVRRNLGYGLVVLWAFVGILVKHVDPAQFANGFPAVRTTAIVAIVVLTAANAFVVLKRLAA
jgi:hypothetical protein